MLRATKPRSRRRPVAGCLVRPLPTADLAKPAGRVGTGEAGAPFDRIAPRYFFVLPVVLVRPQECVL